MLKFEIGERVVAYDFSGRVIGKAVKYEETDNTYFIKNRWYHEKQCRRLKKKVNKNVNVNSINKRLEELENNYIGISADGKYFYEAIQKLETRCDKFSVTMMQIKDEIQKLSHFIFESIQNLVESKP